MHTVFDLLAWSGGLVLGSWVRRRWVPGGPTVGSHPLYCLCAILGAVAGAYGLGTLNMVLSGVPGVGRSILGGIGGAILAVEAYKRVRGVRGSTGLGFVAPLAFGIAVGRIGCFLSGVEDFTFGIPTDLPWGWDFGDGLRRHPVQLYESLSMAAFLLWFLRGLARGQTLVLRHGFALFVAAYAGQRFVWEFLKPYAAVAGPFNAFHLVCALLLFYSAATIRRAGASYAR